MINLPSLRDHYIASVMIHVMNNCYLKYVKEGLPNCLQNMTIYYVLCGRPSIYLETKSNNVHNNPWVVTLRSALTPRPRYMRAIPAIKGLGALGSGPNFDVSNGESNEGTTYLWLDEQVFPKGYGNVPQLTPFVVPWFLLWTCGITLTNKWNTAEVAQRTRQVGI